MMRHTQVILASAALGASVAAYASTAYAPEAWNADEAVRENNNCYNYATDRITGTFAQPGRHAATPITALSADDVASAASHDGLTPVDKATECQPGCCRVALTIAHERFDYSTQPPIHYLPDFHWYRLDGKDSWSHKPGQGYATNKDALGQPITDPEQATREIVMAGEKLRAPNGDVIYFQKRISYDECCRYFCVCGGVEVQ